MPLDFLIVFVSIAIIAWSADTLMDGAIRFSQRYRISGIVVGLLIGFATSVPEITVSVVAALEGNARIAIGNAIGSNIANIGLVVAVGALVGTILSDKKTILVNFAMLGGAYLVLGVLLMDAYLSSWDAVLMLALLLPALYYIGHASQDQLPAHTTDRTDWALPFFAGLLLLVVASHYAVESAVNIARFFGVDEILIGLTLLAIGTSIPELASFVAGVMKRQHGIAVGNIAGSNLFNTFAVIGIAALIQPLPIEMLIIERDFAMMVAIAVALLLLLFIKPHSSGQLELKHWKGAILLIAFIAYLSYLAKTGLPL